MSEVLQVAPEKAADKNGTHTDSMTMQQLGTLVELIGLSTARSRAFKIESGVTLVGAQDFTSRRPFSSIPELIVSGGLAFDVIMVSYKL